MQNRETRSMRSRASLASVATLGQLDSRVMALAYTKATAVPIQQGELKPDHIVIAVMGPTGSGKTTFVSEMTNHKLEVGDSLISCTKSISMVRVPSTYPSVYGDLVFVDTPGFDDTTLSDVDVLKMIYDWLKDSFTRGVKLSGLLYFHQISDNRMAGTRLKNLHMFEKLCGKQMFDRVILVTTMWSQVDDNTGRQREEELKEKYWKPMVERGSQTQRFLLNQRNLAFAKIIQPSISAAAERNEPANDPPKAQGLGKLRLLQRQSSSGLLLIQEEAKKGYSLADTSAGRQLCAELEKGVDDRRELLHRIKDELENFQDDGNQEKIQQLMADLEKLQKELAGIGEEIARMKIPITEKFKKLLGSIGRRFRPRSGSVDALR